MLSFIVLKVILSIIKMCVIKLSVIMLCHNEVSLG
jgi:hypothetical protein